MRTLPTVAKNLYPVSELTDVPAATGFRNTVDRVLIGRNRVVALVILGQSNGTNTTSSPYAITNGAKVKNFNLYDGGLYAAKEPLLGCGAGSYGGHTFGGSLADLVLNAGACDEVILIPIAIGSTEIMDWTPTLGAGRESWMWPRVATMMSRYAGFPPITAWLWMIGEQDAGGTSMTTQQQFIDRHDEFRLGVRALGSNAAIFMPQETHPYDTSTRGLAIRAAQAAVVSRTNGVYQGPDVDLIGDAYRQDGIHIGVAGVPILAAAWFDKLTSAGVF